MIVYIMTNVSCFALYFFKYRDEFKVWSHLIIPILATIAMLAPLAAALIPDVIFGPENANVYPITLGLPITVIWFLIGVAVYLWLRAKRPARARPHGQRDGHGRAGRRGQRSAGARAGRSARRLHHPLIELEQRDWVDGPGAGSPHSVRRSGAMTQQERKALAPRRTTSPATVLEIQALHEVQAHRIDSQVNAIGYVMPSTAWRNHVAVAIEVRTGRNVDAACSKRMASVEAGLVVRGVPRTELQVTHGSGRSARSRTSPSSSSTTLRLARRASRSMAWSRRRRVRSQRTPPQAWDIEQYSARRRCRSRATVDRPARCRQQLVTGAAPGMSLYSSTGERRSGSARRCGCGASPWHSMPSEVAVERWLLGRLPTSASRVMTCWTGCGLSGPATVIERRTSSETVLPRRTVPPRRPRVRCLGHVVQRAAIVVAYPSAPQFLTAANRASNCFERQSQNLGVLQMEERSHDP